MCMIPFEVLAVAPLMGVVAIMWPKWASAVVLLSSTVGPILFTKGPFVLSIWGHIVSFGTWSLLKEGGLGRWMRTSLPASVLPFCSLQTAFLWLAPWLLCVPLFSIESFYCWTRRRQHLGKQLNSRLKKFLHCVQLLYSCTNFSCHTKVKSSLLLLSVIFFIFLFLNFKNLSKPFSSNFS